MEIYHLLVLNGWSNLKLNLKWRHSIVRNTKKLWYVLWFHQTEKIFRSYLKITHWYLKIKNYLAFSRWKLEYSQITLSFIIKHFEINHLLFVVYFGCKLIISRQLFLLLSENLLVKFLWNGFYLFYVWKQMDLMDG